MKSYEVLARRYCAFLGEDPDEEIEGLPVWRIALADLEAAINALETFGVSARSPMNETDITPNDDGSGNKPAPPKKRPKLRRVA
ncbi:hypothetical protein [Hirschia maritima]|uniref:hypothetical protein n=1 Tax=Hirschia maritima TaxID=1121961 RepID=UPI00036F47B0|nr:hypothetical protein [Hirschia maritima]